MKTQAGVEVELEASKDGCSLIRSGRSRMCLSLCQLYDSHQDWTRFCSLGAGQATSKGHVLRIVKTVSSWRPGMRISIPICRGTDLSHLYGQGSGHAPRRASRSLSLQKFMVGLILLRIPPITGSSRRMISCLVFPNELLWANGSIGHNRASKATVGCEAWKGGSSCRGAWASRRSAVVGRHSMMAELGSFGGGGSRRDVRRRGSGIARRDEGPDLSPDRVAC